MTKDAMVDSTFEDDVQLPENVYNTKVEDGSIFFYIQSQSPRAWGTFVSQETHKPGLSYDATSLKVKVKPSSEEPYFLPVQCNVFEEKTDFSQYVAEAVNNGFSKLDEVTFKNLFSNAPLTLALGYYHFESWKKIVPAGYKFVKVVTLVAPSEQPEAVALAISLTT